jgi:hypothetical protein
MRIKVLFSVINAPTSIGYSLSPHNGHPYLLSKLQASSISHGRRTTAHFRHQDAANSSHTLLRH